ncbi:MAG: hypothetical protein IT166_23150, partial [Bryobacterales bacterium]|nr:hypothetical protein [Bryobacterales bacterium]
MNTRRFVGVFPVAGLLLMLPGLILGQSLTLAPGSAQPGDTIPLNLSLSGTSTGIQPASLQFSLAYNTAEFSAITVNPGTAATSAGKSITCNPSSGQVMCMVFGINTTGMGDGVVAVASVTLSTSSASTSRAIQLTGVIGADPSGNQIAVTAAGGVVQVVSAAPPSPTISTLACSPATVNTPGSAVCTVGLTQQAPGGGVSVSINSNTGNISTPASVAVAGGASTASFTVNAASVAADTSGQITAALNGSSQAVVLTLLSPAALTSLACTPSSLGSGALATCTVSLSKAVAANTAVAMSDNSASLTVPASVTVAAGSSSGSFTATAGTVTADGTATVTASLNGVLVSTSLSLVSPAVLTSLACTPSSLGSGAPATCTVSL